MKNKNLVKLKSRCRPLISRLMMLLSLQKNYLVHSCICKPSVDLSTERYMCNTYPWGLKTLPRNSKFNLLFCMFPLLLIVRLNYFLSSSNSAVTCNTFYFCHLTEWLQWFSTYFYQMRQLFERFSLPLNFQISYTAILFTLFFVCEGFFCFILINDNS